MLPENFRTYFDHECSSAFADRWSAMKEPLQRLLDAAERRGGMLSGGYIGGLRDIYSSEVQERSKAIMAALETAAVAFRTDLSPLMDEEIVQLAESRFTPQVEALRGAYKREIESLSAQLPEQVAYLTDTKIAAASAGLSNGVRRFLWKLHNVPKPMPAPTTQNTMNVHGTVMTAVQAGANSVTHIQQTLQIGADATRLIEALGTLRAHLAEAEDVPADAKQAIVEQVDQAHGELAREAPNKFKVTATLSGVGTLIQTMGSLQGAWDVVKVAASAFGINL
ncbi:hypothetical protein [Ramlibacter sp. AN1133]|uniref:hypothetical protein n=1 Tax=Ramlibacter sp. AN1133 TaxID=3133429 RepID=UPI0030BF9A47